MENIRKSLPVSFASFVGLIFVFLSVYYYGNGAEFYAEFPEKLAYTFESENSGVGILDVHEGALSDPHFEEFSHPERFHWLIQELGCGLATCNLTLYGLHAGKFEGQYFYEEVEARVDFVDRPDFFGRVVLNIDQNSLDVDGSVVSGLGTFSFKKLLVAVAVILGIVTWVTNLVIVAINMVI